MLSCLARFHSGGKSTVKSVVHIKIKIREKMIMFPLTSGWFVIVPRYPHRCLNDETYHISPYLAATLRAFLGENKTITKHLKTGIE